MAKPPLQDIIMKHGQPAPGVRPTPTRAGVFQHESNIPLHLKGRGEQEPYVEQPFKRPYRETNAPLRSESEYDALPRTRRKGPRWLIAGLVAGVVVLSTSVVLSMLFSGVEVLVYPKEDTIAVNATVFAARDGKDGALPFESMVIERTVTQQVTAREAQNVEEYASGEITIYNEYSESPQRLIKNTRFQSSVGKIYRVRTSVEVPGKKGEIPGSVTVTVFAEEPGADYNTTGPGEFTIPGFVKLPQEGKVYGRSAQPIVGGFVGTKRIVDATDRAAALKQLEEKLRDELMTATLSTSDKPEGYLFFKGASFFEFNALPDVGTDEDATVTLSLGGKLHSVLFPEEVFAMKLAEQVLEGYGGSPIRVEDRDDITVSLALAQTTTSVAQGTTSDMAAQPAPWLADAYTVTVQGKAHFVWEYDEQQFARDLVGKDKDVLEAVSGSDVFEPYPGIDHAQANFRPFWMSTFPSVIEHITVKTQQLDE